MDSPWDDDAGFSTEAEWSKISNEFTNVATRALPSFWLFTVIFRQDIEKELRLEKSPPSRKGSTVVLPMLVLLSGTN
jgi:hypothetical protein